jgi:hypothetical protein
MSVWQMRCHMRSVGFSVADEVSAEEWQDSGYQLGQVGAT